MIMNFATQEQAYMLSKDIKDLNDTITNKKLFLDTSIILENHASGGVANVSYTATEDCYVNVWSMNGVLSDSLYLDGILIANSAYASVGSNKVYNLSASFYMKKGQTMTGSNLRYIVIGLTN